MSKDCKWFDGCLDRVETGVCRVDCTDYLREEKKDEHTGNDNPLEKIVLHH